MSSTLQAQVEQKFYLRWVNFLLYPTFQITSLSDLKDGYLLAKICETVLDIDEADSVLTSTAPEFADTSKSLNMSSTKFTRSMQREWAMNNITEVYNYCDRMNATVDHIPGEDILAGKVSSMVNLLAEIAEAVYVKGTKFQGVSGEVALLQWVREIAMGMLPVGMSGFGASFMDGYALNVLALFPGREADEKLISSLKKFTALERNTAALSQLTDKGMPAVFDPPDIAMGLYSPRSMKAYVGMLYSLYNKYPLRIIPGVKREKEKIEQYRRYRSRKEEEMKRRRSKSSDRDSSSATKQGMDNK